MASMKEILRRLEALESRLAPAAVDEGAFDRLMGQLDATRERMEVSGMTPPTAEQLAVFVAEWDAMWAA
jgi:hypothetical protein